MVLVGLSVAGFLLAMIGTRLMTGVASRHGVIDVPNDRSSHRQPMPRGGGLSVVVIYLVFLVVSLQTDLPSDVRLTSLWLLCGGVAVAVVGFLDDLGDLIFIFG